MFYHLPVAAAALSMASSCSGAATEAARARGAGRWTAVSLLEADRARVILFTLVTCYLHLLFTRVTYFNTQRK